MVDSMFRKRALSPPRSLAPASGLWLKNLARVWTHLMDSLGTWDPTRINIIKLEYILLN